MSEPASREIFYPLKLPTELYLALVDRMSKTKLSKGDCLIDMLTETAFREGYLPKEHYDYLKAKYGTKTLMEKVLENREAERSVKVEVSSAKLEVQQKSMIYKSRKRDYSNWSLEELQKRLEYLKDIGDSTEIQFVAAEIKNRLAGKGVKA